MRVLGSTTANDGHFGPLVPYLRACAAAGHEVAVAAPESYAGRLERAGFDHRPFADALPELIGPVMGRLPQLSFEEANATVAREVFARIDAQAALPGVRRAIDEWRPDVVLRETAELGSLAAAVAADVPQVHVVIGMQESGTELNNLMAEPLPELAALVGVDGDRLESALRSAPVLSLVPASLDHAGDADFVDLVALRCRDEPPEAADSWVTAWGEDPLVYVTFGSVAGSLPPFAHAFRDILDALAALPVRVLMTVGRGFDIEALGTLPANAQVEPWLPQAEVLREAAAVVCHGGFGTVMGSLVAGRPLVVMPLFTSDQVVNGRHVAATHAGRTVSVGAVAEAALALTEVLDTPSYAASARSLADEIAALPTAAAAVALLEDLTT